MNEMAVHFFDQVSWLKNETLYLSDAPFPENNHTNLKSIAQTLAEFCLLIVYAYLDFLRNSLQTT